MSTVSQPLSWLFSAFFEDGSIISQDLKDKSEKNEQKSAFYDVLEKQKESNLNQLSLVDRDGNIIIVDFRHGRFFVNGVDFSIEGQDEELTDRKVIYFREALQHQVVGQEEQEPPYINRYFIGYEGKNSEGKVVQKVVNVGA